MVTTKNSDFLATLQGEFKSRKTSEPSYSLRKFATDLEIEHSYLSKILRGVRPISELIIARLGPKLGLNQQEIKLLKSNLNSGVSSQARSKNRTVFRELPVQQASILSKWHYYALLELMTLEEFLPSADYIARSLKIDKASAESAIRLLCEQGLIIQTKNSSLVAKNLNNSLLTRVSRDDLKNLQKQFLTKSIEALEAIPFDLRDHSGITLAVSSSQIREAKRMIKNFRRKFMTKFQSVPEKDAVYQLAVSFFPLSHLGAK